MKHLFKLTILMLCFWAILPFMHAQPDSTRQLIGFAHDNTPIHSLQFSKDGKYLMAISSSVVIWDIAKKEKVFTHTMPNMVQNACLAKDTNLLAIRHNDNEIIIMEANNRTVRQTILLNQEHSFVKIVAFVRENQVLMVQQERFHYFYSLKTGALINKQPILGLQYFMNGWDRLTAVVEQNKIKIHNFENNQFLGAIEDESNGAFQQLHYCGSLVAVQRDNKIHLWETFTYKSLIPKYLNICHLAKNETFFGFDHSGLYYLAGYDTLKLWDTSTKSDKWVNTPLIFGNKITAVNFSPLRTYTYNDTTYVMSNDTYLAAGDAFGNIKIWQFSDENVVAHYYKDEIENEFKLIRRSHWSETKDQKEMERRKQKSRRAINNKYLGIYWEKLVTEQSPINLFLEAHFAPKKE
jgi:WD40 repeat protein